MLKSSILKFTKNKENDESVDVINTSEISLEDVLKETLTECLMTMYLKQGKDVTTVVGTIFEIIQRYPVSTILDAYIIEDILKDISDGPEESDLFIDIMVLFYVKLKTKHNLSYADITEYLKLDDIVEDTYKENSLTNKDSLVSMKYSFTKESVLLFIINIYPEITLDFIRELKND